MYDGDKRLEERRPNYIFPKNNFNLFEIVFFYFEIPSPLISKFNFDQEIFRAPSALDPIASTWTNHVQGVGRVKEDALRNLITAR